MCIRDSAGTVGVELIDVYERWGLMPKWFATGDKENDEEEMIEGHIVISGLETGQKTFVHLVEANTNIDELGLPIRPYEEAWYSKVPGRWYGRGPAEKVLSLQTWLNTVVNIRINRAYTAQLGIFKVRKGSGITPQMMSGLTAMGALQVNSMDDIQQIPMQDASQASYNDEEIIKGWAQMVTSTFEVATGEALPASTPATNAVLQNRASQSQFVLVKEGIGEFLQRWLKRQFIPLVGKTLTKGEVQRLTGSIEETNDMDEKIANKIIENRVKELTAEGRFVNPDSVPAARRKILRQLRAQGEQRFVKLMENLNMTDYEVQVFVTNEEIDKSVLVQNLISVLQVAPSIPELGIDVTAVAESIFDVMGVDSKQFKREEVSAPRPQVQAQAPRQGVPQQASTPTEQRITTAANLVSQG
jgi:hypothetical protein